MNFGSLKDKRALVTGGGSGIGFAVAKELKAAGADVVITGSNEEKLQKASQELGTSYLVANLSSREEVDNLIAEAGGIDVLVNNAGITRDGVFMRQADDVWDEMMAVNLDAAMRLSRGLMKGMSKKRWGRILFVTSVVAHMGNPGQVNYVTAKAALGGLAKSLAKEMARRNITVNCIAPGFIETAMTDKLDEKAAGQMLANIPLGAFGKPEDIAGAARFLASEQGRYITGTTLHVNGGMFMA